MGKRHPWPVTLCCKCLGASPRSLCLAAFMAAFPLSNPLPAGPKAWRGPGPAPFLPHSLPNFPQCNSRFSSAFLLRSFLLPPANLARVFWSRYQYFSFPYFAVRFAFCLTCLNCRHRHSQRSPHRLALRTSLFRPNSKPFYAFNSLSPPLVPFLLLCLLFCTAWRL